MNGLLVFIAGAACGLITGLILVVLWDLPYWDLPYYMRWVRNDWKIWRHNRQVEQSKRAGK